MSHPQPGAFDAAHAAAYDRQFESMRAIKDGLQLVMRAWFADLPADARILLAGAGTGAEARFLAPLFPGWRFTLVDPSAPMLDVARGHAEAEGFADRCTFHHGYVADLPETPHEAAASVLVSHFLADEGARRAYFESIAARLRPGGRFYNADLCADREAATLAPVMDLWLTVRALPATAPQPGSDAFRAAFGTTLAAHGPAQVESFIREAGFTPPVACFQALLIRAWTASRA